jgi:adenylate kinase
LDSTPRLVLFGPPGAGKGTQAQLLKDRLGAAHVSSGDLFRYHLRQGTELGQRVSQYINQGLLVPDEVTIDIILDKVLAFSPEEGFILDGFPRTTQQAQALEQALNRESRPLDKVVFINVPEEELLRRLGGRYICRNCQAPHTVPSGQQPPPCSNCGGELYQREDDQPQAVSRRIEVYQRETMPVLDFYRQRGLLADVAGVGSVECINRRVLTVLGRDKPANG